MTVEELSNEFDVMLNSYASKAFFGDQAGMTTITLNEYEKSVYLTKSQEETIISFYSGRNDTNISFEKTEEVRAYLRKYTVTKSLKRLQNQVIGVEKNSSFFKWPEDLWFIVYDQVTIDDESAGCWNGSSLAVIPVTYDEYARVKKNPFRGPNNRRVLRLDGSTYAELISKYKIGEYIMHYLKRPSPIILIDLPDGLSINEENKKQASTPFLSHSLLHWMIVERAVFNAIRDRGGTMKETKNNTDN